LDTHLSNLVVQGVSVGRDVGLKEGLEVGVGVGARVGCKEGFDVVNAHDVGVAWEEIGTPFAGSSADENVESPFVIIEGLLLGRNDGLEFRDGNTVVGPKIELLGWRVSSTVEFPEGESLGVVVNELKVAINVGFPV
jgi:hypothetical protein